MISPENSQTILGDYLTLFARTEVFIYVFMEIVTKIVIIQRVLFGKARSFDYLIFILVFGGFSIFGTLVGTPINSGGIINIRDLSPMIAGLAAGPVVGLGVGLIGGIHRFLLGGVTALACSLSTVLAGLIGGFVYLLNGKKLLNIIPAILFAICLELFNAALTLTISRPYSDALEIVLIASPGMIVANSLGLAICIIVIRNTKETSFHEFQNR